MLILKLHFQFPDLSNQCASVTCFRTTPFGMYLKEAEEDALSEDKGILTVTTRHCRNEKESFAKTHGTVTKDKKKMA